MPSVSESMDSIIYVGIGIFVLVLVLSLTYQGYAQSANQMATAGYVGATTNFTKYAGTLPNTFGGALQLAVFALVFIAVILAVVGALRGNGGGQSGGFLGR